MQTIPRVKLRKKLISISNQRRKVYRVIKRAVVQNPVVNFNPGNLSLGIVVLVSEHLGDCGSNGGHSLLLAIFDDLSISSDEAVLDLLLGCVVRAGGTNIVDAFENQYKFGTGLL
ncbi:hypothetical protein HG530_005654 [Fusarium avenaceum]|nr:hypothetical protein HG530_005654 [Fusarium avenaceum]